MKPEILELDAKGIIPKSYEEEELFIKRGNLTLQTSKEIADLKLINALEKARPNYKFSPFQSNAKIKDESLEYVKTRYGCDLSWIKFLNMCPVDYKVFKTSLSKGIDAGFLLKVEKMTIILPVIAIFVPEKYCFVHELIHVVRKTLLSKNFYYYGREEFEEAVSENKYFDSSFFSRDHHSRMLYKMKRRLQKSFGNNHGYVFIRLEHEELMEKIIPKKPIFGNPANCIKKLAGTHLKYRILQEKLGL